MRTIECLAHQYPDKTARELFEIQEQDKIKDQEEYEKLHQKQINFVNDVKENGGYYRGIFGLDQRFMYKITDIHIDDKGTIYVDVESIVIFLDHSQSVNKKSDFRFEKNSEHYKNADTYAFNIYDRVTEKEWNELNTYLEGVAKFWE